MLWDLNLIYNISTSRENARIEKFIIKNIEYPRFFSYFNHSKDYIFSTLYFIKKSSLINLFKISESEVPNRILFENSPEFLKIFIHVIIADILLIFFNKKLVFYI
jgi:hypothetical protein